MRIGRPLDRYVFSEFWKVFFGTAIGFPVLVVIIDLTDHLQKYLAQSITPRNIALSYLYYLPESAFLVLPAAVLFATVFSIGSFTRHAEITAAKASGISFYRLVMPIVFGAVIATGLDLGLGELMPVTSRRRNELLNITTDRMGTSRFNFAYAGEYGRVYNVSDLHTDTRLLHGLEIERKGSGETYPTYLLEADTARYDTTSHTWQIHRGGFDVIPDTGAAFSLQFASARDAHMSERPIELMAEAPAPDEMRYRELARFIVALERSGSKANDLRVELALKIAIPFTCIIIALFGAPLATSNQRGGAAYGIAISLATTVLFLLLIQLTRAVGTSGIMPPAYAAWLPGVLFGILGLILMARVRT